MVARQRVFTFVLFFPAGALPPQHSSWQPHTNTHCHHFDSPECVPHMGPEAHGRISMAVKSLKQKRLWDCYCCQQAWQDEEGDQAGSEYGAHAFQKEWIHHTGENTTVSSMERESWAGVPKRMEVIRLFKPALPFHLLFPWSASKGLLALFLSFVQHVLWRLLGMLDFPQNALGSQLTQLRKFQWACYEWDIAAYRHMHRYIFSQRTRLNVCLHTI